MATIEKTNAIINGTVTQIDPNKTYDVTPQGLVEHKDPLKEKWYKSSEAAKEAGVSRIDIRNAIYGGSLLATKIPDSSRYGFHYLIKETDLIEWLDDKSKVRDQKKRVEHNKKAADAYQARKTTRDDIPVDENGEAYLSTREFAAEIGMSIASVNKYIQDGKLVASNGCRNGQKGHFIPRSELNKIDEIRSWSKPGRKVKNEEPKTVDIPKSEDVKLEVLITHIKALLDNTYQKGFEDGKLSVEHDISDEYRKGFEEGKKQAKDELLAMLKGV